METKKAIMTKIIHQIPLDRLTKDKKFHRRKIILVIK
jgi:hypothetical protein